MFRAIRLLSLILASAGILAASSEASVLPQIQRANELHAATAGDHGALTKHYVEVEADVRVAVRGARERRQVRFARWIRQLDGDRRRVYEEQGFPVNRLRLNEAGRIFEIWTYPVIRRQFVFRDGVLVRTRLN